MALSTKCYILFSSIFFDSQRTFSNNDAAVEIFVLYLKKKRIAYSVNMVFNNHYEQNGGIHIHAKKD